SCPTATLSRSVEGAAGRGPVVLGVDSAHGLRELLGRRLHEVARPEADPEEGGARRRIRAGREDRDAGGEGLGEGIDREERGVPEVGPDRIEEAVADLVGDDVRALTRERRPRAVVELEELEAVAVVEGVEVWLRPQLPDRVLVEVQPLPSVPPRGERARVALPGRDRGERRLAALPEE